MPIKTRTQNELHEFWRELKPLTYTAASTQTLYPPRITDIHQIGGTLSIAWTPLVDAQFYEVWFSASSGSSGATPAPAGTVYQNTYRSNLPATSTCSELLEVNRGFENGNLDGWATCSFTAASDGNFEITSTSVYSGSYCLFISGSGGFLGTLRNNWVEVIPNETYRWSFNYNAVDSTCTTTACRSVGFYDSSGSALSAGAAGIGAGGGSAWLSSSGNMTAPSNAKYFEVQISFNRNNIYVDNFSVYGKRKSYPNYYYAVRAYYPSAGSYSGFSQWLQPVLQTAAIGNPEGDHNIFNPDQGLIESSNFSLGASGYRLSTSGQAFTSPSIADFTNAPHNHSSACGGGSVVASSPACARVYNSASQNNGGGAWVALTFDSERYDTDSFHSTATSTNRLTCPSAGKYRVGGNIGWAACAAGTRGIAIRLNGATFVAVELLPTNPDGTLILYQNISTEYDCASGDYFELMGWQNSGAALGVVVAGNYTPEFTISMLR